MSKELIYAMSTKSSMKIDEFNEIFKIAYLSESFDDNITEDINTRLQVIRTLDSLGYCEFNFDDRTVHMCKPSLVLLPGCGVPKVVLVGARTPDLIRKLKETIEKRKDVASFDYLIQSNTNINIPSLPLVKAININILKEIATETDISYDVDEPAAWKLANFSSSLDEIKRSLVFIERVEPEWKQRIFMTDKLIFFKKSEMIKTDNILVEYKNPITKQLKHWFWSGKRATEVERDWGRFLALTYHDQNILLYDNKLFKLAVPVTIPLPCIIARAIALCEGKVPFLAKTGSKIGSIPFGHLVHIYSGIPPAIALLISKKLGQKINITSLINCKDGMLYA